jgi:hypothetical protein
MLNEVYGRQGHYEGFELLYMGYEVKAFWDVTACILVEKSNLV